MGAELEIPGLMDKIAEELVLWLDEPDMGAGATTKRAALNLKDGIPWSKSGISSKTCGSLMRVGILGFVYQNNPEKLVKVTQVSGRITHSHPIAEAASIAGAYAVKLALDSVEPGKMFESLIEITKGISPEFTQALKNSYNTAYSDIGDEEGLKRCGQGW